MTTEQELDVLIRLDSGVISIEFIRYYDWIDWWSLECQWNCISLSWDFFFISSLSWDNNPNIFHILENFLRVSQRSKVCIQICSNGKEKTFFSLINPARKTKAQIFSFFFAKYSNKISQICFFPSSTLFLHIHTIS